MICRTALWIVSAIAVSQIARAQPGKPVSLHTDGWSITADASLGEIAVSYKSVGSVLEHVRLNLSDGSGRAPLQSWKVDKAADGELSLTTAQPPTTWLFIARENRLEISSTVAEAIITAQAPAPAERIVARLIDREGAPVNWSGTGEVAVTYGGSYTRDPSFLPRRNPDCLYLALGQVSAGNLHSLFDRASDTAIDFPELTTMKRDAAHPDELDIVMPIPGPTRIDILPGYYLSLGLPFYSPFDDSYFRTAPMIWSSWTSYYSEVTEADIVKNADWISTRLGPYGFQFVQLDDGYDRGENGQHYWIEKWDRHKFPHGPEWLTSYIRSKGLHAGIWLVPNAYAGAFHDHPDWYLFDNRGEVVLDYNTPALDSTNPAVLGFLRREFTTLDGWGFEYYKFDGEHALPRYVPGVDTGKLFDKAIDPIVAYRHRLQTIREVIGPRRFVECDVAGTPLNGIGFFNSYFNGHDVYNNWQGMHALFSSINAHGFLNHIVTYTMPGEGMDLEPRMSVQEAEQKRPRSVMDTEREREYPLTGLGVSLEEARTLVSHVALTGVAYSVASVMPDLPAERTKLLQMTLPTMPIVPVDLFSRGTDMEWDRFKNTTPDQYIHNYPEVLDLKVSATSGTYDVVGLTNWRSWTARRELSFSDKLGLDPDQKYVAFDFWNQRLYGVFHGGMGVEIAPHDTRVFQIHALTGRPRLVGISRHISGAYSILDLVWDEAKLTLRGTSQGVPEDPYSLWIYVPAGEDIAAVNAVVADGRQVAVAQEIQERCLRITFPGQQEPVRWTVAFR